MTEKSMTEKGLTQKRITVINADPPPTRNLRVAAYCRISTLIDNQMTSIDNQEEHYTYLIQNHAGWDLAGIYIEEGVTGTRKEIRPELIRLFADCRAGKIDIILTKSISRFARNLTDCLEMVRSLSSLGVRLIFEKENIDTFRMGNEFILTILSSLAEEESHSISENEKWAIIRSFKAGTYHQSKAPYGFKWSGGSNGLMIPDEADAAVVNWIFDEVLKGSGTSKIAKDLNEAGLLSPQGRDWSSRTVIAILRNPAAIGDLLHNKTYKDKNYRTHNNFGEKPMYYYDEHHAAIVEKWKYDAANAALIQRGKEKGNPPRRQEERHHNARSNRYPLTGKIYCAECGAAFRRTIQYTASRPRIHWECCRHHSDNGSCSMLRVLEENVKNAFLTLIHKLQYAPFLLDDYCEELFSENKQKHDKRLSEIAHALKDNAEKRKRLALLYQSGCASPLYSTQLELEEESAKLKDERNSLTLSDNPAAEFRRFIRGFDGEDFPEEAFVKHVDRVVIHSQTRFTFALKCGLRLTEEIDCCGSL